MKQLFLFFIIILFSLNTNSQTINWTQDYNGGSLTLSSNSQWDGRSIPGHEENGWMDETFNMGFIRTLYISNGEEGYDGYMFPGQAKVVRVLMAPGVQNIQISGTWAHSYSGYTLHGWLPGETGQIGGNTPEFEPGLICEGSCSAVYINPNTELYLYADFLDDQKSITREELGIPINQPIWISYIMYQDHESATNYANTLSFACSVLGEENINAYRTWMQQRPWWDAANSGNTADGIEEFWDEGTTPNLEQVGFHVANQELTNTTPQMEYQLAGTKTWNTCMAGTTTGVEFVAGNVEIREIADIDNYRLVTTLVTPDAPVISVDYIDEATQENITTNMMYSYNLVDIFYGNGTPLALTPGEIVYFAYIATETNLASEIQNLTIPTRPAAPTSPDVNDEANTFGWTNNPSYPNATDYEYTINNGTIWFDATVNPIYVGDISIAAGDVQVRIKAVEDNNFKSNELLSDAPFGTTNIDNIENIISIYPNPVSNSLTINTKNIVSIQIINITGKTINSINTTNNSTTIDLSSLAKGTYFVKILTKNSCYTKKIIKL